MNLVAWILSLSILILLIAEGVDFHRATLCRQKAWLRSTELVTGKLLHNAKNHERSFDPGCKTIFLREKATVTWRRLPKVKSHQFLLELDGHL